MGMLWFSEVIAILKPLRSNRYWQYREFTMMNNDGRR